MTGLRSRIAAALSELFSVKFPLTDLPNERHHMLKGLAIAALFVSMCAGNASGGFVFITEFCSDTGNGQHFEFVEFTNVGSAPVNMTGWSEDDSHATPFQPGHSLTGLGTLAPGESGIITEATPADFRAFWGPELPATVPVVGPYTNGNLSTTSDSITLFDSTGKLVDRLDYSTTNGGTADMVTRNGPLDVLGKNDNALWRNSYIGDSFGSFSAAQKPTIVGNPGHYRVPEPSSIVLIAVAGVLALVGRCRG
jgi:hypothetical protein